MKIERRNFLIYGSLFGLSSYVNAREISMFEREFKKVKLTISAVQEHMFPPMSKLPSAKDMNVIAFLFETVEHQSFDKDIRDFIIEGAQEFMTREKGTFISMSDTDKEKALRDYEKTNYGSSWISRIMTITMEGMFGDPIYGSNVKEAGWKALGAYSGLPRPSKRYLDV